CWLPIRNCAGCCSQPGNPLCRKTSSFLLVCGLSAARTSLCLRPRYSLTAIMENDDSRAHECCAPAKTPAGLNGFDDGEEAKPVINRFGNPTVSPGNVAEMNISVPIRHGVFVARFGALADERERFARSKVLIRIAAALDPRGGVSSPAPHSTWGGTDYPPPVSVPWARASELLAGLP